MGYKILIAEDEDDIRAITEMSLEEINDLKITACTSGKEAIEKAAEAKPDLILLDVMMPEMDGPTTLKELRKIEATGSVPVIFMTAKVQPDELEEYRDLGAIDIIKKPFDPLTLADKLKEIWEKHYAGR